MNFKQAMERMVMPHQPRPTVRPYRGVIQIWVLRSCDKSCFGCTQGSNLVASGTERITPEQFEQACISLKDYFGVVGMFGGNPALHPEFDQLCDIMARYIPFERRGLWCNKLFGKGEAARRTFNPAVSNLNVHLNKGAYEEFKRDWPESNPFGLTQDSRHAPPYVAIKDLVKKTCTACEGDGWIFTGRPPVGKGRCTSCDGTGKMYDEEKAWDLISSCDINRYWSAMIGVFRKQLRGWFCEIAGAQAMLHQHDPSYPDTGLPLFLDGTPWWQASHNQFSGQVFKHCQECGVPLRGRGFLSQDTSEQATEQVSETHQRVYKPKSRRRDVELVTSIQQLDTKGVVHNVVDYLGNAQQ